MAVTVVGFAGSARRNGNSETLLDWCLEAARAEGARTQKIDLCDLDLRGCRACDACFKDGTCIQKDDMQPLYPLLRDADSLAIAAPVYAMGLPGVPKMMIDRTQPFWALRYILEKPLARTEGPERLGAFLSCSGTDLPQVFEGSRRVVRYLWHVLGVTPAGEVLAPKVDERGAILAHDEARVAAEELGRKLGRERQAKPGNTNDGKGDA